MSCSTSWWFRHNCSGGVGKCEFCRDCYCSYHLPACGSIAQLVGGHSCPSYTAGAVISNALTAVGDAATVRAGGSGFMDRAQVECMNALADWIERQRVAQNHRSEASLSELANMAEDVYELHEKPRIRQSPPSGWQLTRDQYQQPNYAGGFPKRLAMAVYTNSSRRLAVLALKGTSLGSASDIHQDFAGLVRGEVPVSPAMEAIQLLKKYQDAGWGIMVTGHSLGGYMAELLASHLGIAGAAFCAPGCGWHEGQKGGGGRGFVVVNVSGDAVIGLIQGVPFKTSSHPYRVHTIQTGGGHDIAAVREYWGERPGTTNRNL